MEYDEAIKHLQCGKPLTLRQKIFIRYYFFKLIYGRAHTYIDVPQNTITFILLLMVWVKLWLNVINMMFLILSIVLFFVVYMLVGYIDIKYGFLEEETAFNNQFNPDLMEIKKNVKGKK